MIDSKKVFQNKVGSYGNSGAISMTYQRSSETLFLLFCVCALNQSFVNYKGSRALLIRCCLALLLVSVNTNLIAHKSTTNTYKTQSLANTILLMRHALAPGFGDPDDFQIGNCQTQRNLDAVGRQQAKRIGKQLQQQGIEPTAIYSSQWCRCWQTAELMNLGEVTRFAGLNSYYQGLVDRQQTLQTLQQLIDNLPHNSGPYLFVTHQVVISDLTDIFAQSGEIIAYQWQSKTSKRFLQASTLH